MFMKAYGHDLLQSFLAYGEGDYDRAVDLLYPIRHEAGHMGGSTLYVSGRGRLRKYVFMAHNHWCQRFAQC